MLPMRVQLGNVMLMADDVIEHLRAEVGEIIFYRLVEKDGVRVVELVGEKAMNEWMAIEEEVCDTV